MAVKIEMDKQKIVKKLLTGADASKFAVAMALMDYGNNFVRVDQGQLRDSVYTSSEPEKGKVIWDTPYAKKVYYTGAPSTDVNPQASLMWADKAKKVYKKELQQIAQNAFNKGIGGKK